MLTSISVYAIFWFSVTLLWIVATRERRLGDMVTKTLSSWELNNSIVRLLEGDPTDFSGFEVNIHIKLVITLALIISNVLVLCISVNGFSTENAVKLSGQLAGVNLLSASLLCHRHSILGLLAGTCKPEILWVHFSFGWLTLAEILLHSTLSIIISPNGVHWSAFAALAFSALMGCFCLPRILERPWRCENDRVPRFVKRLWCSEGFSLPFLAWRYSHLSLTLAFIVLAVIHAQHSVSMLGCALTAISIIVIFSVIDFQSDEKISCTEKRTIGQIQMIATKIKCSNSGEYYVQKGPHYYYVNWFSQPVQHVDFKLQIGNTKDLDAALDPLEESNYMSTEYAKRLRLDLEDDKCQATTYSNGREINFSFRVENGSSPIFRHWKKGIILGKEAINMIDFDENVKLTIDNLRHSFKDRLKEAFILMHSQPSEFDIRGPFPGRPLNDCGDDGYTEILALDQGINRAFALFQHRLRNERETKLRWFPENADLVAIYSNRYKNRLSKRCCIYWPREKLCPQNIEKYVIRASKEETLFAIREDIKRKAIVFGESLKSEVAKINRDDILPMMEARYS